MIPYGRVEMNHPVPNVFQPWTHHGSPITEAHCKKEAKRMQGQTCQLDSFRKSLPDFASPNPQDHI
jgi:hypothetical protein